MDDRQRERLALESRMCAWGVRVRLLTQRLLSLGRPLDVAFDLEALRHPKLEPATTARDGLEALGLSVAALFQSSLLMVTNVDERARRLMRVTSAHVPSAPDELPVSGVATADFLVGLNDLNLLDESLSLAQVRRRVAQASAHDATLVLRFVRLDRLIRVDPSRGLGHGHVLQALAEIDRTQAQLCRDYDDLMRWHRPLVTKRLVHSKKLLTFVAREAAERRDVAMDEELFRFMANFQHWYSAVTSGIAASSDHSNDDDDDSEARDDGVEEEGEHAAAHYDDSGDVSMEEETPETQPPSMTSAPESVPAIDFNARAKLSRSDRLRLIGAPETIDTSWHATLPIARLKWLPNAQTLLSNFVDGLVESFLMDAERWTPAIVTVSRAVADRLLRNYVSRLETMRVDNATVRRDFLQHARMLRSNMAHRGNGQLRTELLAGAVSIEQLCAMSSEQLAPESLQAERQRRSEQHAKEITITAPVGPALVKTKHGFKEVNFGSINTYAATTDSMNEPAAAAPPPPPETGATVMEAEPQQAEVAEQEAARDAPDAEEVTTRFTDAVHIKEKTCEEERLVRRGPKRDLYSLRRCSVSHRP
ncbi:hypothetical protein PINS_up015583 [Pythium insidiosum]|nr:hypothetical protein PINS_up015583 [Pythium insidiosum]